MTLTEIALILVVTMELGLRLTSLNVMHPFIADEFKSDVLHTQISAMTYFQTVALPDHWGADVSFNSNGNVNEPVRFELGAFEIVIRLGTGRFDVARLSDD